MTLALRKSLQHQQMRLFWGQEVRPYAELSKAGKSATSGFSTRAGTGLLLTLEKCSMGC